MFFLKPVGWRNNMTKKQFTAIAKILGKRLAEKVNAPIAEYEVVEVLALDFASYLKTENPRFDEDRFLEAVYTGKLKTV
jgi:hypothetical protein